MARRTTGTGVGVRGPTVAEDSEPFCGSAGPHRAEDFLSPVPFDDRRRCPNSAPVDAPTRRPHEQGQPHLEAASGFEPEYGALQAPA